MILALVLVHNRSAAANRNQVTALAALTVRNLNTLLDDNGVPILDAEGNPMGSYYYTISGLSIPHTVKFYQAIPFGISPPNTLYNLDSHKVFYGQGDNDKIGFHPRFFNWGLKRATDFGADIVAFVDDHAQFTVSGLEFQINRLVDRRIFVEALWGKACNLILLREVGQLREDLTLSDALTDLRLRVIARGWEYG